MILTRIYFHIIISLIFQLLNKMSTNDDMTFFGQSHELDYSPKFIMSIAYNIHHFFNKWNHEPWHIINRAHSRNRRWNLNRLRLWVPSRWWKWRKWCFTKTRTSFFRKWWSCWWRWWLTIWILGINNLPRRRDSTSRCNFSSRPRNVHFFIGSLGWYFSWWWRHHGGFRKCQLPQNLFDFKLHLVRDFLETFLNSIPLIIDRKAWSLLSSPIRNLCQWWCISSNKIVLSSQILVAISHAHGSPCDVLWTQPQISLSIHNVPLQRDSSKAMLSKAYLYT